MTDPLKGLAVLNTRPSQQASKLTQNIKALGGGVIECPTIEIKATSEVWVDKLPSLQEVYLAIFISANAVHFCFQTLHKKKGGWPKQIQVIAIGQATAQALESYHIKVHDIPKVSDSEHLLQLPCFKSVNQKTVLLFKGEGGRPLVETFLKDQQANLICLDVYKRTLPKIDCQLIESIWRNDLVDIILVTSEQSLQNLFTLFGKDALSWLQSKACLVISKRLEKKASLLGMKQLILSSPDGILNTLLSYKIKDELMPKENEKDLSKDPKQTPKIEKKSDTAVAPYPHLKIYILLGILMLLTLAGLATSFYFWQVEQGANKELALQIQQIKAEEKSAQEKNLEASKNLQTAQKSMQDSVIDFKKQWQKEFSQSTYQNQDWVLFKARYYLELAEITRHWSRDYATSIALLEQTDALFKQLNESKILAIRQALAKDIAQLKAIPTLDSAGLLSQLEAAQMSVSQLSFQSRLNNTKTDVPASTNLSAWRSQLKNSMNLLSKLVVIRKDDEQIKPMISPLLHSLIKESILFNLQAAQWAVLSYNPQAFQLALKQAIAQIKKFSLEEQPQAVSLLKQLKTLQETSFPEAKPVISQTLDLVNQLIKEKERLDKPLQGVQ